MLFSWQKTKVWLKNQILGEILFNCGKPVVAISLKIMERLISLQRTVNKPITWDSLYENFGIL